MPPGSPNGRARVTILPRESKAVDSDRIQRAVADAIRRREKALSAEPKAVDFGPSQILPNHVRLRLSRSPHLNAAPPRIQKMVFPASVGSVLGRLFIYSWAAFKLLLAQALDKARGDDTIERRAERLRRAIEEIGGTAVKLGQQAAMRIDLIPYEYAMELSQMLDSVPPFSTEYAFSRMEATLKRPIGEVFEYVDPNPIGSASVGTVFQAYLRTGERVAIKVRRPRVGEQFAADCRALGIVLRLLELLTIIRPGLSSNFLFEFSSMLMEELDFSKEARYTELFRRDVHKNLKRVSAPRVYFEYYGDDVLVTEFVKGIWLRELLAAVETNDVEALRIMKQNGIDPNAVARSLIRTIQFTTFEGYLFHADPHPANVVVQTGNRLVFIDFGCCGAYTSRERFNWRQVAHYRQAGDVGRLVQSTIAIMEPLPPIDLDEFSKKVEMVFWQDMWANKSKHAKWWERTSARVWIAFLELAREYNLPMQLNTLRMIRSTLMYETITARLSSTVSSYKELARYQRFAGERARRRIQKQTRRFLTRGLRPEHYLKIEQLADIANRAIYVAERSVNTPPFRFMFLINKAVYAVTVCIRSALFIAIAIMATVSGRILYRLAVEGGYRLGDVDVLSVARETLNYKPLQLAIAIIAILGVRRILFRFMDIDVPRDRAMS
jgi:ubiquinone biosynthesis protein